MQGAGFRAAAGTLGGEVGCGGVARGTSGPFRWYRRMGPLRVRIGRPGYDWPMDPRPAPGTAASPTAASVGATVARGAVTGESSVPAPGASSDFDGRPGMPDRFGRALRDLRISVTDRCNFRCPYCMPAEVFGRDFAFLPRSEVLSFEELERVARVFVALGVHKLRVTGGEPLVRRDLPRLVELLAALRTPDGAPVEV